MKSQLSTHSARDNIKKDKEEEERKAFLSLVESIDGYSKWKSEYDALLKQKALRVNAFNCIISLLPKLGKVSLRELAWTLGISMRQAGKNLRIWKDDGKVIVLTKQTIGHPYVIIAKENS